MSEIRIDKISLPSTKVTKEGYIKGEACVTRAGIFEYINQDGSIRRELRHPDEVFKLDSLETLKCVPITNDHPQNLVNSDNAANLMVGMTGETIKVDNNNIIASLKITHKDGIAAINKGKRELSMGYTVDVITEDGYYNGESYTHRQSNIRYNHLAIVEKARAGRVARINLDGALVQNNNKNLTIKESTIMNEEEAKGSDSRVDQLEKLLFAAEKSRNDLKVDYDALQARHDESKALIDELKASRADSLVNEKAIAKVALLTKANKILKLDEEDYKLSNREIMEKAIYARDSKIDLKDKSDDYVLSRFDSIIERLEDTTAIASQMKHLDTNINVVKQDSAVVQLNSMFANRIKNR